MKSQFIGVLVVYVITISGAASAGPITVEVFPILAPNGFGSPSFSEFNANAQTVLGSSGPINSIGTPSTPTFLQVLPNGTVIPVSNLVVTDFSAWLGQANPGGAFANEVGNRLHFGFRITSSDPTATFSISQLRFFATGDPIDFLNIPTTGDFDYSNYYVGVKDGGNVVNGTSDTLVTGLFSLGVGNAYEILNSSDFPGDTLQDKINNGISDVSVPFPFTGTYFLDTNGNGIFDDGEPMGSATVIIGANNVPEPASIFAMSAAILRAGIWACRRTKRNP